MWGLSTVPSKSQLTLPVVPLSDASVPVPMVPVGTVPETPDCVAGVSPVADGVGIGVPTAPSLEQPVRITSTDITPHVAAIPRISYRREQTIRDGTPDHINCCVALARFGDD